MTFSLIAKPALAAAPLQYGEVIGLAGLTGSVVVHVLVTWSKEECIQRTGTRVLQYPNGIRLLIKGLWALGIGLLVLAGFAIGGPHAGFALAFATVFNAMVLTLHLFVFGKRITWDEFNIYVHPLWGRMRVIPFSSVVACEFSKMSQQYRVRTDGQELVKVNVHWAGVPEFLEHLPCATPAYPPV